MNLSRKMYIIMFRAVKEAMLQMDQQNYGVAKATLMRAQFECESLYMDFDQSENIDMDDDFAKNDEK